MCGVGAVRQSVLSAAEFGGDDYALPWPWIEAKRGFAMRALTRGFTVIAVTAMGIVGAQVAPNPETTPDKPAPNYYPGSTAPSSSDTPAENPDRDRKAAAVRAQIRQCMAEERGNQPALSDVELEQWCRVKVNSKPRDQ